jgi:CRP-like cAMP-binding protein
VRTIEQYLPQHPFFAGLDDDTIRFISGCAQNEHVRAGKHLFKEGKPADSFYVVRHGRVSLEAAAPGRGPIIIDMLGDGDVVGWSWLVPPYRWMFDARAVEETSVVALDGACLRSKCDDDPRLGYLLMQRVSHVMVERLTSAHVRLLDLYGAARP